MKIAYFDCPSGAAGDMIMAALVDAGASLDALRSELRKLPLEGWELVGREVRKGAFRATKVDVEIDPHAHPHHRALGDVLALLEQSGLGAAVREKAARVFTRLADAEARAHGTTRDRVRRSEEHTSELQSQSNLVCRLLLEKKKHKTRRPLHS